MTALALATYQDILRQFQDVALSEIKYEGYKPFVYPYRALGVNLVILYLLLPPIGSRVVYLLRYPIFAFLVLHSIDGIVSCRSTYPTVAYGIGLLNSWAVLWCATLIIFNDARSNFKRIEEIHYSDSESTQGSDYADSERIEEDLSPPIRRSSSCRTADGTLHVREEPENPEWIVLNEDQRRNMVAYLRKTGVSPSELKQKIQDGHQDQEESTQEEEPTHYYQTLPSTLLHRLDWVFDLVSSFRGPRWAHRISGLTPPPSDIQESLKSIALDSHLKRSDKQNDVDFAPPTNDSYISRHGLLYHVLPELIINYIVLDIFKTITMMDGYFYTLGPDVPSPFMYPRPARLLITAAYTYTALQSIFLLAPIVFVGLLGEERIGAHAWTWLYTPYFGSLRSVAKKGLAGAWGLWWQQLFRFGFQEAGEAVARVLDGYNVMKAAGSASGDSAHGKGRKGGKWRYKAKEWGKRTQKGMILRVVIAFGLSGILHACAAHTSMGPTYPITGSAMFFWMQPIGLIGQKAACAWMKKKGWIEKMPWFVREAGNLMFVAAWFALTGPLIADDFARTGIWLFEPVPISPIRGFRGEGWWRWGGTWIKWYSADKWWMSGFAF